MILYHGSNIVVDHPSITKGKPFKDFGQSFYLSDIKEQAMEMALRVVERVGTKQSPVVSSFEFDEDALSTVYNSVTFKNLQNTATGYYYQSIGYLYDDLQAELSVK